MKPRFKPGQKLVCNATRWINVNTGQIDQGNDPEFNEVVTLKKYFRQTIKGYYVILLEEYPHTPYVEREFEEYIEDSKLAKLLCGQKV